MIAWVKSHMWVFIVFIFACYGVIWYGNYRAERASLEKQRDQLHQANEELAKRNADLAKLNQDIQSKLVDRIAVLEKQKAAVKTPEDSSAIIKALAGLKDAPVLVKNPELPDAPSSLVVTAGDSVTLARHLLACEQTGARLEACELTGANLQKTIDNQKSIIDNKSKEVVILSGGHWWQKLGKAAKCAAVAGGGAGLGSLAGGTKGAAIGGAVGVGVCQLKF